MSKKESVKGMVPGVAEAFFAALAAGDEDAALGVLRAASFTSAGAPTPRSQAYMDTGEWDTKDRLGIIFAREGTCFGRVGVAAQQPEGSARFCGRTKCPTASHKRATVEGREGCWYIQGGPRSLSGFFLEPNLPSWIGGGPIPRELESRVDESGLLPEIRMTLGQWKFIFREWTTGASQDSMAAKVMEGARTQDVPPAGSAASGKLPPLTISTSDAADSAGVDTKPIGLGPELKFEPELGSEANVGYKSPPRPDEISHDSIASVSDSNLVELKESMGQMQTIINGMRLDLQEAQTRIQQLERKAIKSQQAAAGLDANVMALQGQLATHEMILKEVGQRKTDTLDESIMERIRHEVMDPSGALARIEYNLNTVTTRLESGSGVDFHGYVFASGQATVEWFDTHKGQVALFADAVALLHAINATVVHTPESNRSKEAAKKIDLASELEAAIIASFSTTLPSILVGNQKDTQGGAYECLMSYLKTYTVWNPLGPNGTSGLKHRIRDGTRSVSGRLRTLQSVLTTSHELKEVAMYLISDSLSFIVELSEFVGQQYEELCTTSSFTKEAAWSLIIDCMAHIFVELGEVRGAVVDAGQMKPGMFLWGLLRAWEVQERYRDNQFKNDPALTGLLVRRILVHDGEQNLKDQLATVATHEDKLKELAVKLDLEHKESIAFQKKVKGAVPAVK